MADFDPPRTPTGIDPYLDRALTAIERAGVYPGQVAIAYSLLFVGNTIRDLARDLRR